MKRILSIVITAILAGAFAFTGMAPASASSDKGAFYIEKNCADFHGYPGEHCTITKSTIDMIPTGSLVIYAAGPVDGVLCTDITLKVDDENIAYGHVHLVFETGTGFVTFKGGTGQFRHFHAEAVVSYISGYDWAWVGTYHFNFNPAH